MPSGSISASDVQWTILYNLLKTLEERGEVAREQLPGRHDRLPPHSLGTGRVRRRDGRRVRDLIAGIGRVTPSRPRGSYPPDAQLRNCPVARLRVIEHSAWTTERHIRNDAATRVAIT